jgi:large subunit ribosomal protein L5
MAHQATGKQLEKVVVNVGVGKLRAQPQFDEKVLPEVMGELALITGQRPAPRQAAKSVASFKTRQGDIVGLQGTLRGRRAAGFFAKVVHLVLPRVKDFRGVDPKNVDASGNLNLGFREQYVFPEINAEKSRVHFGLQVTAVPLVRQRESAMELYQSLGVPFRKR